MSSVLDQKRVPQYKIIEKDLRESISIGRYKPGDMIPAEIELASSYGVSRVTVRKALDHLTAEGLLQRSAGVGTFVKSQVIKKKVPQLLGFTDEITQLGMVPTTKVTMFELIQVPRNLYQILQIDKDEMVYHFQRIRYANEIPFLLETSYMSARLYPDISLNILNGSKYHYVEDTLGLKIAFNEHTVTPVMPPSYLVKLFGLQENQPIIKVDNTTHLENGQILDLTEQFYNSPKYQLRYFKQ